MDQIRFQRRERRRVVQAPTHSLDDVLRWLAGTTPPVVLDVRDPADHDSWSIPGSLSIPAKDVLEDRADLPFDRTIVVVSANGDRAADVAARLRATGRQAGVLAGGMDAWQGAWNVAHRRLHDLDVVQIRKPATGALSYLIARHGEAIVVDPCVAADVYEEQAALLGVHIGTVAETGVHADTTASALAADLQVPLIGPQHLRLAEEDPLPIGGHVINMGAHQGLDLGDAILTGRSILLHPDDGAAEGSVELLANVDPKVHILPGAADQPPGFDGAVWEAPLHQVRKWHAA